MSDPDCQGAQYKQLTQYLLIPRSKWEMLQIYWKFPYRNVQTYGFVYHDTDGPHHGLVWKTQSFFLSEICTFIFWQDCCGKCNLRKFFSKRMGKVSNWKCLFVHSKKGLFLFLYVEAIKLAWKKQNLDPMWKVLNEEVDSGEPTSFLDHVYLVCTKRDCATSKDIDDNYRTMFESRISAGRTENYHARKIWVSLRGLWQGRSCQENCETILWVGKWNDTTRQADIVSHGFGSTRNFPRQFWLRSLHAVLSLVVQLSPSLLHKKYSERK